MRRDDHIIAMRKVLPLLLMLAVTACASTMRWEKPGISDEGAAVDLGSCRHAASLEANRYYYPWGDWGWGWGFGRRSSLWWQMRADDDRFLVENRLTNFCMRTKGYEQVQVQSTPRTQAPPAPSPEPPLTK